MLHPGGVDETLFVQILHAYSARNPMELIHDDAYDACLARMGGDAEEGSEETQLTQGGAELQQRYGAKLFVREGDRGERILVAGTKKRNLQLIPLRQVYATLCQLAQAHDQNATQLKQAVKAKVVGIPEEIVQEYCDMAASSAAVDEGYPGEELEEARKVGSARSSRGTDGTFLRCSACGIMKSYKSFAKHKDQPLGVRSRCKACEMKARQEKSEGMEDSGVMPEAIPPAVRRKKKESYLGLTGTAICAACGERKPVREFDKARQKPFTLKCRACTAANAPLMSKLCCSCQLDLSLDHFYRDSYTKAGFRPRCMDCMKAQKGMQYMMETPSRATNDAVESDLYFEAGAAASVDENCAIFPSATSKRPRSKRNRRKTQKSKEAADARDGLEESFVEETGEARRHGPFRGRGRRKTRRGRRGAEAASAALEVVEALDGDAVESGAKLGALNSLALKAQQEDKRKVDGVVVEPDGLVKQGRGRGLTGCTTVKDPQGNVTKYCTGCLDFKDTNEFGRDVSKPSGLRSRCRRCQKRGRDSQAPSEEKSAGEGVRKKIPRKPVRKKSVIAEKICARCDHQKPITEFYRDKSKDDSYAVVCKKCAKQAKIRAEKAEKREASQNASRAKAMQEAEEVDMELVMSYVDALQPESSAFSAEAGDDEDDAISAAAAAPPASQHRVCIGCKTDKNWIEFDLNPMLPDGMCPLCKECRRGNGMRGRRLTNNQDLKRKCLRCGISKSAIHFTKSIFFPNRTSRFCEACRAEEESEMQTPAAKRIRIDDDCHLEAVDLMDFELDQLRVKDPGGGEQLWKKCASESEVEETERRKSLSTVHFKKGTMPTQVKSDGHTGVTITHHVPAGNGIPTKPIHESSSSFVWNGYVSRKAKTTHLLEKQCKRCGETKQRGAFYVDKDQLSQLNAICIDCCTAMTDMAH